MKAFLDHDDLVDTIVQTTLASLTGAVDWQALDARLQATLAHARELPLLWLRTRLGLSPSEERVVWLLVAHELSPEARARVRGLAPRPAAIADRSRLGRTTLGRGGSAAASPCRHPTGDWTCGDGRRVIGPGGWLDGHVRNSS